MLRSYATKQYSDLKQIAARPEAQNSIPLDIRRFLALREGRYADYVREAGAFRRVTAYGLLGALLILGAWFVYLQQIEGFEAKRLGYSVIVLAGGMIFSCFVVPLYDAFAFGLRANGTYQKGLIYYVLIVGLEEALKVVPVLLVMRLTHAIDQPLDYIIYGSISALGFAFVENLLPGSEWRLGAISTRALGAVVLHMTQTSLIMYGLFYSRYRVQKKPLQYFLLAFGAACVLHGIFDFSANRSWGILAALVQIYCIREYGVFINYTLNLSERNPDRSKRQLELTEYLCYALAAIVMLQYVAMAVKYGPSNANSAFRWTAIFSYFWLCMILVNLGSFDLQKRLWLPIFEEEGKVSIFTVTTSPCGSLSDNDNSALCRSQVHLTMARPSPLPISCVLLPRVKRSSTFFFSLSGMPGPLSATNNAPSSFRQMLIRPSPGVNFTALSTRFRTMIAKASSFPCSLTPEAMFISSCCFFSAAIANVPQRYSQPVGRSRGLGILVHYFAFWQRTKAE